MQAIKVHTGGYPEALPRKGNIDPLEQHSRKTIACSKRRTVPSEGEIDAAPNLRESAS